MNSAINYAYELAMLKLLLEKQAIKEVEYKLIKNQLKKKYKIHRYGASHEFN